MLHAGDLVIKSGHVRAHIDQTEVGGSGKILVRVWVLGKFHPEKPRPDTDPPTRHTHGWAAPGEPSRPAARPQTSDLRPQTIPASNDDETPSPATQADVSQFNPGTPG